MPLHKLQELCTAIQYPIILLGGKEDAEEGKAIAAIDDIKIYNACGKFNLNVILYVKSSIGLFGS